MRAPAALALTLLLATGCSDDPAPPAAGPSVAAPSPSVGQRISDTTTAVLDGVELELEVADEQPERAVGLMGRTQVPAGTGMVFLFGAPVETSFYMFQVPVPLTAVFVRDGTVVHVAQMAPCTETDPRRCPLYGPDVPFDTVVETAPSTLPDVKVGDRLELRR